MKSPTSHSILEFMAKKPARNRRKKRLWELHDPQARAEGSEDRRRRREDRPDRNPGGQA